MHCDYILIFDLFNILGGRIFALSHPGGSRAPSNHPRGLAKECDGRYNDLEIVELLVGLSVPSACGEIQ